MRTLIIVHCEPDFESYAPDLPKLVKSIIRYSRTFDRVINVTSSFSVGNGEQYEHLLQFEQQEWIWGYDADYYKEEEPETCIDGETYIKTTGHQYSFIEEWMKELPKHHFYTIVGGCRNECLQDVYEIFDHLNLKPKIKENLTY